MFFKSCTESLKKNIKIEESIFLISKSSITWANAFKKNKLEEFFYCIGRNAILSMAFF